MEELPARTPKIRRNVPSAKQRAFLTGLTYTIKGVAFFSFVVFLYTAGARDSARSMRSIEQAVGENDEDGGGDTSSGFIPFYSRRHDWRDEGALPKHCELLAKNPLPFDKTCKRKATAEEGGDFRCADGRLVMFSQFKQDYILYKYHFQNLKRPGNYLDVAANEAIGLSNTYFFDRCLGWSGLCVEGNPRYFEKLHRLRSCALLPTCVGEYDGQAVDFILKGGSGGIDTTNKGSARWIANNENIRKMKIRCTTIGKELHRYRTAKVIDYMSLDVEGHELHVLHGIDWKATKINVITIEVSRKSYAPIQEFMSSIGYKELTVLPDGKDTRVALGGDALFLAPDVIFGQPE